MKFTLLSVLALAAASSVSALPSDSTAAMRARDMDAMSQFATLHVLDKRGLSNGHKCKNDEQCDSEFCKSPGWFKSNVCEPKLHNGSECETNTVPNGSLHKGAKCDRNAECKSQICEDILSFRKCVIKENGESCSNNHNCESGFCYIKPVGDNHRCLPVNLPQGKHCVSDVQCASKKCNNTCE